MVITKENIISPKVSVIMPAYNQGVYIAKAISSILNQTYPDWEAVIVDDGSTDSTKSEVAKFEDPRLRYVYQKNKGVSEARNLGLASSSGEYLAFLDADDMYDLHNLETQVAHLDQNEEIGLTYCSRMEIDQSGRFLSLHRSPKEVSVKEFVLGFPFAPTDFMVRRDWAERVNGFSNSLVVNEDRDFLLRLALAGCQFARVDKFLSYRRRHSSRVIQNLPAKLDDMLHVVDTAFNDLRCPSEVLALKALAHRNIYLEWAYQASVQDEIFLAKKYFRDVLRFDPAIFEEKIDELLQFLVDAAIRDGGEHEPHLRKVFARFPSELRYLSKYCDWAVACGYLLRGVREVMWDRIEIGSRHFKAAAALGAQLDERFFWLLRYQLMNYEAGFGPEAARAILENLSPYLKMVGGQTSTSRLKARYSLESAYRNYTAGEYAKVPGEVMRAVVKNPKYLTNRKLLSILYRSIICM